MKFNRVSRQAQSNYQDAIQQAFWRKARTWLGRGCNDLLSFHDVFEHLKDQPQYHRGLQRIALSQIVGSVANRKYQGVNSNPVLLYKVGEAYFVEDGNHRVSVARVNGEEFIQANVIEIDVSNLTPEPSCTRLGYKLNE